MNENELKSIERYYAKLNEDVTAFNEFEANDFIKLLKKCDKNDEAIEVGRTFLQMAPALKNYINQYGYALYNKFINVTDEKIQEKESLFFSILDEILELCKQERYSPYEASVNRVIKYASNQKPVNYTLMLKMLDKLDFHLLSDQPLVRNDGREMESYKERYFRLKVRALYETQSYKQCIETANLAYGANLKWHFNAFQWIKYYRGCSLVETGNIEEASREFLALNNRIKGVNFQEVIYKLLSQNNKQKEANAYMLYEFFEKGFDIAHLNLYMRLHEATVLTGDENLIAIVSSFIKQLCNEANKECDLVISEKHASKDASHLYDDMYEFIMSKLSLYVERKSGKIVYYNQDSMFGNIQVYDKDPLFFRESDFVYVEDIERNIVVDYTVLPTYDTKKQRVTEKAILITIDHSDYDFING